MTPNEQATAPAERTIPLAFDANGEPLKVPERASAWRVRRGGGRRGRPRAVFNREGRQLEVPIESTVHDLADYGCPPGRYRLEAITRDGRLIAECVAVTEVPVSFGDDDDDGEGGDDGSPAVSSVWAEVYQELHDRRRAMNEQSATLCRAFEAMAQAFGPVRAIGVQPAPELIVAPPAASEGGGQKMEQYMPIVMQLLNVLPQVVGAVKAGVADAVAASAAKAAPVVG
jgi:hypothetical protein